MARRKRKKFKQIEFNRDLSNLEIQTLEFLWMWKVAPITLLKEKIYKTSKWWTYYKIIRRLKSEKIIYEIPKGKYISHRLLSLTELGYDLFARDFDFIRSHRFRVHAPAHDYLATCLQLGDFLHNTDNNVHLVSEQKMQTALDDELPDGFTRLMSTRDELYSGHIPDGLTAIYSNNNRIVIGYEVELNLKPADRYNSMQKYWFGYRHNKFYEPDIIFFLVRNGWIAKKILNYCCEKEHGSKNKSDKFAFIDLNDFTKLGWDAPIRQGLHVGLTVRKVHENYLQIAGKDAAKITKKVDSSIYFPKYRSPQKSIAYAKTEVAASDKHRTPSLEGANLKKVTES